MSHPYTLAPDHAFWSRAITRVAADDVDPCSSATFRITRDMKIGTGGSCFAQHLSRHLRGLGIEPFVTEWPHPEVADFDEEFHYGIYSARYGNLYTARQALQLFLRAFGRFTPVEQPWRGARGEYIDPFRPLIPGGFAALREFERDRERHFAAVRRLFLELDVFVFTLGLTETWISREDGAVFPSCPGTAAGVWDERRYAFHNFSVAETVADLRELIAEIRKINSGAKFILTVSPVPLVATASGQHALTATTYSKAALRVAAQEVAGSGVDYFPSFEIVTGAYSRGRYFAEDCRNVTEAGVAHVMRVFARHYIESEPILIEPVAPLEAVNATATADAGIAAICDEIYNEAQQFDTKTTPTAAGRQKTTIAHKQPISETGFITAQDTPKPPQAQLTLEVSDSNFQQYFDSLPSLAKKRMLHKLNRSLIPPTFTPRWPPPGLDDIKLREYAEYEVETIFDAQSTGFMAEMIPMMTPYLSTLGVRRSVSALDVGPRTGSGSALLAELFPHPGNLRIEVDTLDNEGMWQDYQGTRWPFIRRAIVGDVFDIPDGSYDLVLCSHTIEHVDNAISFANKLARIAREFAFFYCPYDEIDPIPGHYRIGDEILDTLRPIEKRVVNSWWWRKGPDHVMQKCVFFILPGLNGFGAAKTPSGQ